jgi:hypothetical protein
VARCLVSGLQRLMCGGSHDCGRSVWTGEWPGTAECAEFGWAMFPGGSPEEYPDLNRLVTEGEWDRRAQRWRQSGGPVDDAYYVHWHASRGLALPVARYTIDGAAVPEEVLPALAAEIAAGAPGPLPAALPRPGRRPPRSSRRSLQPGRGDGRHA